MWIFIICVIIGLIVIGAVIALIVTLCKVDFGKPQRGIFTDDRGREGEIKVAAVLKTLAGEHGKTLMDYIFTDKDKSVQVDNILICHNGVFVIETKNYSGRIYGDSKREYWTQVLNYGKEKHKFFSPIKQNEGHVRKIKKILPRGTPVYSLVVFVQDNVRETICPEVVNLCNLKQAVWHRCKSYLTQAQIEKIYNCLLLACKNNEISDEQHAQSVIRRVAENRTVCPYCKSKLVLRTSKNNIKFWGCSKYPFCNFTRDI